MTKSYVAPQRNRTSFYCSHCGVMSQKVWRTLLWEAGLFHQAQPRQGHDTDPTMKRDGASTANVSPRETRFEPPDEKDPKQRSSVTLSHEAPNMLAVAECQNCKEVPFWPYQQMFYREGYALPPNSNLSDDAKRDYLEAGSIVNNSPRGAAALLRLCLQELCVERGAKDRNLNGQIDWLVRKRSLSATIQQALGVVRVIGNEAVHPGQLDLRDERETALRFAGNSALNEKNFLALTTRASLFPSTGRDAPVPH